MNAHLSPFPHHHLPRSITPTDREFLPTTMMDRWYRRQVLARFAQFTYGRLSIRDADGEYQFGIGEQEIRITIFDPETWSEVALTGSIGAGTAWIRGWWTCDDAVAMVRLFIRNRASLDGLEGGAARWSRPLFRLAHWVKSNSRAGSRKNISAHYDLGNEFFKTWLDSTMLYSSAYFDHARVDLSEAQEAKCERLCSLLDLHFDDHLLEIGTGWGGFALYAARTYGCRVTTTTISQEQYAMTCERVQAAGLGGRINVLLKDYRDLTGVYDKAVSIEMIEAVGHQYYTTFFDKISSLLRPNGLFAMQAITIAEQQYDIARKSVDYIQKYIFPGSCIPSVRALSQAAAHSSDFNMVSFDDITPHYAETIRRWREAFHDQQDAIRDQGYDDAFLRMWDYYLAYCQGGFAERAINCVHVVYGKNGWRSGMQRLQDSVT